MLSDERVMTSEIIVDLSRPPAERWELSRSQARQAKKLLDVYRRDLGVDDASVSLMQEVASAVVPADQLAEAQSIAEQIGVPVREVLIGNLYYDALKFVWGCTSFAVEAEKGPIHARNLDWGTENRVLNDFTLVSHFRNAQAGDFLTIGWPGFLGALSGVAAGRFAVSLNAVLSGDPAAAALPVVCLLRQALEQAIDFDDAVQRLTNTTIASDCLLLVSGPRRSQMVVIERTPTRYAIRKASNGAIFVTNNYHALPSVFEAGGGDLQATSCGRLEESPSSSPEPRRRRSQRVWSISPIPT